VPPNLHLDPAVLRAAAAAIERLLAALAPTGLEPVDLDGLARLPGGAALVAEHDRLTAAVTRTRRELAEMAAGLRSVAGGIQEAEDDAVRSVTAVDR
jgi:hypothetical protein